jgi:hypothetical protein
MRKAINENRTVQLALVGVLALLGGLFLLKAKGGGSEATPVTTPVAPTTGAPTAGAPTAATPATAAPAAPTAVAAAPTATGATAGAAAGSVPVGLIPGPGLPKGLMPAYRHGNAIALLVRRAGGVDDAFVHGSVQGLRSLSNVKVYVTKARQIARYAWLTQGVNVTDLPALVVLRPRKLSKGKAVASVSYGFRDPASVLQAVKDQLYRGPTDRPYHP